MNLKQTTTDSDNSRDFNREIELKKMRAGIVPRTAEITDQQSLINFDIQMTNLGFVFDKMDTEKQSKDSDGYSIGIRKYSFKGRLPSNINSLSLGVKKIFENGELGIETDKFDIYVSTDPYSVAANFHRYEGLTSLSQIPAIVKSEILEKLKQSSL